MTIIKGKHAIEEALNANINIQEIIMSTSLGKDKTTQKIYLKAQRNHIKIRELSPQDFQSTVKDPTAQQIVAKIPSIQPKSLDFVIQNIAKTPIIVAIDHIEDPYNFGAIMRTCEALGIKTIIYPKDRNATLTGGVIKASSGAVYHLNLIQVANIGNSLQKLKKEGYWIYGTSSHNGQSITTTEVNKPCILVLGNEKKGLSPRINKLVDLNLMIPIKGQMESFNVSVATGILLYEITKS